MAKKWIALYSQTGSEIAALSKVIGRKPDLHMTNNEVFTSNTVVSGTILRARHSWIISYLENQVIYDPKDTIITLHGYLRILPTNICSKYTIYNGHPGAIDLYPELKGKDPQVRTWENKERYKFIGSVVHKVVPEVDAGEIIKSVHLSNTSQSINDTFSMLKMSSLTAWIFAMKEIGLCE